VLHITSVCEHNCPFCYYTSEDIIRRHQCIRVLKQIISKCAEASVKEIVFVGGDPATHPDIIELGTFAHENGIQTTILSNTLAFPNSTIPNVIDAFNAIEVTLHSCDANKHDAFCGRVGAFDNAIANLASFVSEKTHLGIVYNLTSSTWGELFNLVNYLVEYKHIPIDHIVLQRIAQVGRANKNDKWELSKKDLICIFQEVENIQNRYCLDINFEDSFPYCLIPEEYREKYAKPCSWGYESCPLDQNGNVSLCCTDPNYTLGNILETPLLEIWNSAPKLLEKRAGLFVSAKCRACQDYEKCRGGCILSSITNECRGDRLLEQI